MKFTHHLIQQEAHQLSNQLLKMIHENEKKNQKLFIYVYKNTKTRDEKATHESEMLKIKLNPNC